MADQSTQSIVVDAPASDVMAVIADFPAYPQWVAAARTVEVLGTDADGRAEQVHFVLDAGAVSDDYVLAYTWDGDRQVRWTLVQGQMQKRQDGSYTLVARMRKPADAAADAPAVVMPSAGRWSASGGLFVTVATQAAGQALDLRDRNLSAIYAIRALDGQGFSYQHLATGAFYPTRRASADAVLTGTGR